jgi:hypothetical protein
VNPGKYNRSETPSGPSSCDISVKRVRYKREIFVRKRNLEIAFLRYSLDLVTSVIFIIYMLRVFVCRVRRLHGVQLMSPSKPKLV